MRKFIVKLTVDILGMFFFAGAVIFFENYIDAVKTKLILLQAQDVPNYSYYKTINLLRPYLRFIGIVLIVFFLIRCSINCYRFFRKENRIEN